MPAYREGRVMNWPIPVKWVDRWKRFEQSGRHAKHPYRCPAGYLTIGWGRNLDGRGLSEDEADYLLKNDINDAMADLDRTWPWWRNPPMQVQGVILDMCMNMGMYKLAGFIKFADALQRGNYEQAADEMLDSKWHREDVGPRATELANIVRSFA